MNLGWFLQIIHIIYYMNGDSLSDQKPIQSHLQQLPQADPKGRVRTGQEHVIFSSHILPVSNCFQVETFAVLEVVSV